jgi:ribonuclease HI
MSIEFFKALPPHDTVTIYTDGACTGNPGPGGWGVLFYDKENREYTCSGNEEHTTNNRMELLATIEALRLLPDHIKATLYTDSQYVKNGITVWIKNWKVRGWLNAEKKPVKNKDLWEQLDQLMDTHTVQFEWVRGHNGDAGNEKVDTLARQAIVALKMRHA